MTILPPDEQLHEVRLPSPSGGLVTARILVDHIAETNIHAFLDFQEAMETGCVTHTFVAYVDEDNTFEEPDSEWQHAVEAIPKRLNPNSWKGCAGYERAIGFLGVVEYPNNWREYARYPWSELLDTNEEEGEGGVVSQMVDWLTDERRFDGTALLDGSLFVYQRLEVHPQLRAQKIGSRLLAHALGVLPRSSCDVSLLTVYPILTCWETAVPEFIDNASEREIRRLVKIYGRLGFQTFRRRRANKSKARGMYFLHEHVLPFLST